jgi:hypothetical protein
MAKLLELQSQHGHLLCQSLTHYCPTTEVVAAAGLEFDEGVVGQHKHAFNHLLMLWSACWCHGMSISALHELAFHGSGS